MFEASITRTPIPDKNIARKGNHRPATLVNRDAKILNKMLANPARQYVNRRIHYNQVRFITAIKGWFNIWKSVNVIHHINRLKKKKKRRKNHTIVSIDIKKALDKIQYPFMGKNTQQLGSETIPHLLRSL